MKFSCSHLVRTTQDGALTFHFNANGNRQTLGDPGGAMATLTHDPADREATLVFNAGAKPVQPLVTAAG
jgi:hypothetical protein